MAECIVNVTVTSFNRCQSTINCINALKNTAFDGWHLTVVDNNSVDGSVESLKSLYAAGVIDTLLLCNNKLILSPGKTVFLGDQFLAFKIIVFKSGCI